MPAIVLLSYNSTGHDCFPPTELVTTLVPNVIINNIPLGVVGDQYSSHSCGRTTHAGATRALSEGSRSVYAGGISVCRIGDPVVCGDFAGQGSRNVFAGG